MRRFPRLLIGAAAAAAAAAAALTNCGGTLHTTPTPRDATAENTSITVLLNEVSTDDRTNVRQNLAAIPVVPPAPMSGYSRDLFPHWLDADSNGWSRKAKIPEACDVRAAALLRDGSNVTVTKRYCTVKSGSWVDPYTATPVSDPKSLDIDHMVPLANAFRSGADRWTEAQRTAYANAPLVVVTTGMEANRAKGDKGPEAWEPESKSVRCAYAIRWVTIKHTYHLNLTSESERTALAGMLTTCSQGTFQQSQR